MRILLIAPDQPDLNFIPEIRLMTEKHHCELLNGRVTATDVYNACRQRDDPEDRIGVIHFAGHSDQESISLSPGERLGQEDLPRLARMSGALGYFFNSCRSARLAAHATRHGVTFCIATTIELPDSDAWKMPASFYNSIEETGLLDVIRAFVNADNGSGAYQILLDPLLLLELSRLRRRLRDSILVRPANLFIMTLLLISALFGLAILLIALGGYFSA